jgi:CBS domain-containing protein
MKIKDIMTDNPVCSTRENSLEEVARMMLENDCGSIPVVTDQEKWRPAGIITDRDIVTRAVADGRNPLEMKVGDVMTPNPICLDVESDAQDAVHLMEKHRVRRILVCDRNGSCIGIVSQADIARHLGERETGEVVEELSQPSV